MLQRESLSFMSTNLLLTQAAGSGGGAAGFIMLVPYLLIFVVFWIFLIRPQQQRAKEHRAKIAAVKPRDQVVTGGGIVKVRDGRPVGWEGHDSLAELDHDDPRTADLGVVVMTPFVTRLCGVDGQCKLTTLYVNRGFVPTPPNGKIPPFDRPDDPITIIGFLRPSEKASWLQPGNDPAKGGRCLSC